MNPNPEPHPDATQAHGQSAPGGSDTLPSSHLSRDTPHIAGYTLREELGRGGMGVVYRAEDNALRREVAVKLLLPRFAADPEAKARFLREARAQAKVEHDHVAAIFQVGESNGVPFIAMPLLKGMTLQAALRAQPRPPVNAILRMGRELAEGLAAAHERGLIHRDIKPANVWLEGTRLRVKVLDFGLARAARAEGADDSITSTGAIVGTPAYMSPEQAQGGTVDHRSDLFSLGVMLYQMATGQRPFHGPTPFAIMTAVTEFSPSPIRETVPDFPPVLGELITHLLAKNPAERPPTAQAVAEELRQIELAMSGQVRVVALDTVPVAGPDPFAGIDSTEVNTPQRVPPRSSQSPRWLWPVVGLVAIAGVVAAVWIATREPKNRDVVDASPPTKKDNPKPKDKTGGPTGTPPKQSEIERAAADTLREYGDVTVLFASGDVVTVKRRDPLPPDEFVVIGLDYWGSEDLPPNFTAKVLVPATVKLSDLRVINALDALVTADDLKKLAAGPAAITLRFLHSYQLELSPAVLDSLKRFPGLETLSCAATDAGDDVLARLAELKSLRELSLTRLGERGTVTAKGMAAVTALPLRRLSVWNCPAVNLEFCRLIAAMPELEFLDLNASPVGDTELGELTRCPKLSSLAVPSTKVTPAALPHLQAMRSLRSIDLWGSAMTLADAKKIQAALSNVDVTWGDRRVPRKKP